MEALTIDGKKYVKASVIARELGYTNDYVGQLCRAEKVDATLVGRSWYVNESSLHEHKKTRYRSTKRATLRQLDRDIKTNPVKQKKAPATASEPVVDSDNTSYPVALKTSVQAAAREPSYIKYAHDEGNLLPTVSKSDAPHSEIPITLADATAVKIKAQADSYRMQTTTPPKVRFQGELTIQDAEAPNEAVVEEPQTLSDAVPASTPAVALAVVPETTQAVVEAPKNISRVAKKNNKIKVKLDYRRKTKLKYDEPHERNPYGVITMRQAVRHGRGGAPGTLEVGLEQAVVARQGMPIWLGLLAGVVFGSCAAVAVVGASVTVSVSGSVAVSYSSSWVTGWHLLSHFISG